MNSFTFRHISGKVREFYNVKSISNRDGNFMIITQDDPYPEFLDVVTWELWRFS